MSTAVSPAESKITEYRRFAKLAEVARSNGGFTATRDGEALTGRTGYMVSPYPDRTAKILTGKFGAFSIMAFADRNADLLALQDHYIGAWRNATDGQDQVWLDVSVKTNDLYRAATVARDHDQLAVFDLAHAHDLPMAA
jgi:hypothetical protein